MASNKFRQLIAEATETDSPVDETLFRIIRLVTLDFDYNYHQNFLFEGVNSQKIVKLLAFLEHESPRVRKLSLLFYALVVANPRSKMYFLEKCGFGLSFGKVLITRFKYLQNAIPKGLDPASVVRSFILTVNAAKRSNRPVLFWFVPLASLDDGNLRVVNFFESALENRLSLEALLEVMPDPIENMCGFEFGEKDLQEPVLNQALLMSEPPRPIQSTSVEELDYRQKVKSTKQKLVVEKSEEFSDFKGRSQEGLSPANKSVNRKAKATPMEVFQKYRSSIKDRTPSLNVKKEQKSASIVIPKRSEASPIRTPRANEAKAPDPKAQKVQKINEIIQKAKVSKSPVAGEGRGNVSERLSKILGTRTKA